MAIFGGSAGGWRHSRDRLLTAAWSNIPTSGLAFQPSPFDILVVHGMADRNVGIASGSELELGSISVSETERLQSELPESSQLAVDLAPYDFDLDHSVDGWRSHFELRSGKATILPTTTVERAASSGAATFFVTVEVHLFPFSPPGGTAAYVAVVRDPEGANGERTWVDGLPPWNAARVAWDFFQNPSSILVTTP